MRGPEEATPTAQPTNRLAWSSDALDGLADPTISDIERLRMLHTALDEAEGLAARIREERLETAARLREEGHAMIDIAAWAGCSQSYLSRTLLDRGSPRRAQRRAAWR